MHEKPKGIRLLRRRGAAILCSTLALSGVLIAAPAHASTPSGDGISVSVPMSAPVLAATTAGTAVTLAAVALERGCSSVYPVKDGYRDTVKFMVHGLNTSGRAVPVQGTAVLTKAGRTVRTWKLNGTKTVITWNGRVGTAIKTGSYRLTVTAWSSDGATKRAFTDVRVVGKRLQHRTMVVRSKLGVSSTTASLPPKLLPAYTMGGVSSRVRTVATVTGPAQLVFKSDTATYAVRLRNGTHTTASVRLPQGSEHVTIEHDWKPGAAKLKSVLVIWSYNALVAH